MGLTLSHQSALNVTRMLRADGNDLTELDTVPLRTPFPWVGKRWTRREFDPTTWRWPRPKRDSNLHILVPRQRTRMRVANIDVHETWQNLPPHAIIWLDEHCSMVCPELLFLQAADYLTLPTHVLLGYELCGSFTRFASNPQTGPVAMGVPAATSTDRINTFLDGFKNTRGIRQARRALSYVCDNALSVPEAVLATMYSLPSEEAGYGMGPVVLNKRIDDLSSEGEQAGKVRFPDLLFDFAPVGINYDGEDHLDLRNLRLAAEKLASVNGDAYQRARADLDAEQEKIRAKWVDDIARNRQLAARGYIVFPATKEDLATGQSLDNLTRDILGCARSVYGKDISSYEAVLYSTAATRDRHELLSSIWGGGTFDEM